ncbi:MAG: CoA pyrophosphatase [Pseudomonadota bacterium]
MTYPLNADLRDAIARNLTSHDRVSVTERSLRKAAVALVVSAEQQDAPTSIVVTLRASKLNRHGGQYALPGGRLDEGENVIDAALRETHEEVGLRLGNSSVLGVLDDMVTRSGFVITPVVAWAGAGASFTPDPGEVAKLYRVPLYELDAPSIPEIVADRTGGKPVMSAVFPTIGHRMYAPTAALLYQFREVCLHGRTTRVGDLGQPEFTRS